MAFYYFVVKSLFVQLQWLPVGKGYSSRNRWMAAARPPSAARLLCRWLSLAFGVWLVNCLELWILVPNHGFLSHFNILRCSPQPGHVLWTSISSHSQDCCRCRPENTQSRRMKGRVQGTVLSRPSSKFTSYIAWHKCYHSDFIPWKLLAYHGSQFHGSQLTGFPPEGAIIIPRSNKIYH